MRIVLVIALLTTAIDCTAGDLFDAAINTLQNDLDTKSKLLNVDASDHAIGSKRAKRKPSVSASGSRNITNARTYNITRPNDKSSTDDWSYSVSLTQTLYDPSIAPSIKAAKLDKILAQKQQQQAVSKTLFRVIDGYFGYLKLKSQLITTQLELRSSMHRLSQVSRQVELGALGKTELYEAMTTNERVRTQIIELTAQLRSSKSDFRSLTYRLQLPTNDIDEDTRPITLMVDQVLQQPDRNTDIDIKKIALDKAHTEIRSAKAAFKPTIDLSASYSFNNTDSPQANFLPLTGDSDSVVYSLNLRVPIYAGGGNRYSLKEKKVKALVAQHNLEAAKRSSRNEIERLNYTLTSHQQKIERLSHLAAVSRLSYSAIKKANELGTRTLTDVLDAEKRMFDASRDLVSAKYDLYIDYARLCDQKGTLSLGVVQQLSELLKPIILVGVTKR